MKMLSSYVVAQNRPGYVTSLNNRILFRGYNREVLKSHAVCVCMCVCVCVCGCVCGCVCVCVCVCGCDTTFYAAGMTLYTRKITFPL